MSWSNLVRKQVESETTFERVTIEHEPVEWERLVTLDFETLYDDAYTLKKLSTSEYIRDPRFKAQCVGIKIGSRPTKVYPANKIATVLHSIPWATHSLLAHHAQFDGFILSHHYGIHPKKMYCTLSMARALFASDIGAGLGEVSEFLGGPGKVFAERLDETKGVLKWSKALYERVVPYCTGDVDECYRVFNEMLPRMPRDEMDIIDFTVKMFTDPVLRVDLPRVKKEQEREIAVKRALMLKVAGKATDIKLAKKELDGLGPNPSDEDIAVRRAKKLIGSAAFAQLLEDEGIKPPVKLSDAYMKAGPEERAEREAAGKKWIYAFSKTDLDFVTLQEHPREAVRELVEARLSVKSTTNETRAGRFLKAGENGLPLPVYLKYGAAHTLRWGGGNKMNMQNLKRGGELRRSILAPPGHVIVVVDSGQIEARTNAWFWDQNDLVDDFRTADAYDATQQVLPKAQRKPATGDSRDAYCKFGDTIYGREITKKDDTERFIAKTCLTADTLVLTNHGLKPIIEVRSTDNLWDGIEWVKHDGLLHQGIKPVQRRFSLGATPDHEVLTDVGWRAWSEVHTDPSLMQSALSLVNSPLCAGNTIQPPKESFGAIGLFAVAHAATSQWCTRTIFAMDALRGATLVQRSLPAQSDTGNTSMQWPTTSIVNGCSIGSRLQSVAAKMNRIKASCITALAGYRSAVFGRLIAPLSLSTCKPALVGMNLHSRWIDAITTKGMNQGIFGSFLAEQTWPIDVHLQDSKKRFVNSNERTQVYDLANAGPRSRFTVMTDLGPVIVHNCILGLGYQMGMERLQRTLALGVNGPAVFLESEECERIVRTYRRKYARIVKGWAKCQDILEDMAHGREGSYKCISWSKDTIHLPNGMTMRYPGLRDKRVAMAIAAKVSGIEDGEFDFSRPHYVYDRKGDESKIYGGLLCENIVQCLARLVVAKQLLAISRKHRIVMTTHDEGAFLAKKAQGQRVYEFARSEFAKPLPWCQDLPLNSDGGFDVFYSK